MSDWNVKQVYKWFCFRSQWSAFHIAYVTRVFEKWLRKANWVRVTEFWAKNKYQSQFYYNNCHRYAQIKKTTISSGVGGKYDILRAITGKILQKTHSFWTRQRQICLRIKKQLWAYWALVKTKKSALKSTLLEMTL